MVAISKPNPLLAQLLKDLEANGGLYKADFDNIAKENSGYYGESGSAVKRNYVTTIDNLKRRYTAQQYKEIVEANNILPCAQTVNDAMEELKERMAKATVSNAKPSAATSEEPKGDTKEAKKVTVVEPVRSMTPPPTKSSLFSPPSSPGGFKSILSPDLSVTSHTTMEEESLDVDASVGWSEQNPHIIPVLKGNSMLPHGFVSMYSDSVANDEWKHERDVYFISKVIGGDLKNWKACIPKGFGEYRGRCILVCGPSLDYIQADPSVMLKSLEDTAKIYNSPIKQWLAEAVSRGIKKLKNVYTRGSVKNQYYLFVYKHDILFDNTAISGSGSANTLKTFGIKVNSKFGVFSKKDHTNMVAFWAIATMADEDRRTDGFDATLSADIYDF